MKLRRIGGNRVVSIIELCAVVLVALSLTQILPAADNADVKPDASADAKPQTAIADPAKLAQMQSQDWAAFQKTVQPFLAANCITCHGNEKPEADISFTHITDAASLTKSAPILSKALGMLRNRKMPPKDSPQPTEIDRQPVLAWLADYTNKIDLLTPPNPGHVTLRRLNRAEYNNTIRDLLGVDFKPADAFPVDEAGYGFDNNGDVLSIAPLLMDKYLASATRVLDEAINVDPIAPPPSKRWDALTADGTIPPTVPDPKPQVEGPFGRNMPKGRVFDYNGELTGDWDFPADGHYIFRVRGWGTQGTANRQRPNVMFKLDGQNIDKVITLKEDLRNTSVSATAAVEIKAGKHHVEMVFINGPTKEELAIASTQPVVAADANGGNGGGNGANGGRNGRGSANGRNGANARGAAGGANGANGANGLNGANGNAVNGANGANAAGGGAAGADPSNKAAVDPNAPDAKTPAANPAPAEGGAVNGAANNDGNAAAANGGAADGNAAAGAADANAAVANPNSAGAAGANDGAAANATAGANGAANANGGAANANAGAAGANGGAAGANGGASAANGAAGANGAGAAGAGAGARGAAAGNGGARGAGAGAAGANGARGGKPTLGVLWFEVEGPQEVSLDRMPESYRKVFTVLPSSTVTKQEAARQIITNFASRAFRRPVRPDEVDRLMAFWKKVDQSGETFDRSINLALQPVLTSPYFIFRVEKDPTANDPGGVRTLDEFELASRLSYFLWSSMPDDELFKVAGEGKLRENLEPEVRRMMADPKAFAMVENFAGQWLQLRQMDNVMPDAKRFPTFDDSLRDAMVKETQLFFSSIMTEDRSVLDFIDADYTFMNERLARHYGRSDITGDNFRRVSLAGSARGGGLLTQASILTLTSFPNRTSPVIRGKWVLENLLDAAPPPPPPDVPKLAETAQAELTGTLRQRMEAHRANPNCISCHAQMDPIGFGLENFDAIGQWRDRDTNNQPIDPSGTLPDGTSFQGAAGLKQILMAQKDQFCKCLTNRMLTFALGRGMEAYDKPLIDKIEGGLKAKDYKFSALILQIVESDAFQKRAASTADQQ
jgi:hypothetical protein